MFLQRCGIRKWDFALLYNLIELGYHTDVLNEEPCLMTMIHEIQPQAFSCYNDIITINKDIIDCRENKVLFLAIAALNNDNDYMQWFVSNDSNDWVQHTLKNKNFKECNQFYKYRYKLNDSILVENYHKASVNELIEHFKPTECKNNDK